MRRSAADVLHRLLLFFFGLFVFSSTFSIALAQTSFGCALIIFVIVAVRNRHQPFAGPLKWFYLGISAYLGWSLLAALIDPSPVRSIIAMKKEWLFAVTVVGIYLFRSETYRHKMLRLFALGVGLLSIYAAVQYFTQTSWLHFDGYHLAPVPRSVVSGNFSNELTFANFYCVAAFFLLGYAISGTRLRNREDFLLVAVASASMLAALLTLRRGPVIYLMVVLLSMAILKGKGIRWYSLAMLVIVGALTFAMPEFRNRFVDELALNAKRGNESGRVFIWENTVKLIEQNPIFGVGPGNFKESYTKVVGPDLAEEFRHPHAHNDYLNVAARAGIPDAVLFCGLWLIVFAYLWRGYQHPDFSPEDRRFCFAALMGSVFFFLSAMSDSTFADDEVRQMLMFVWAAGLTPWYKISERTKIPITAESP